MAEGQWALTGLGLALLVVLLLPSAQIKLGASQLQGLIGSYTSPHYDVSYSGGTIVGDFPASFAPGDGNNYLGTGGASASGAGKTCTASAKGPLTATFNWNNGGDPTALPPPGAIIVQSCTASWRGTPNNGATVTGTVDNGLGGPVISGTNGASSSSTTYTFQNNPGQTFQVPPACSPSVSFTGTDGTAYDATVSGRVDVNYTASAPPVTISLPGAINDIDGSKKALTGQGVTAQLSALPSGYKVSSYTWSFTGGTPIKNWDPTSTSNDKTIPLAPADLSATDVTGNGIPVADLSFYYTKAGSLTVTCTVNYTSPDGKTGTMTVQSPSIGYLKPTVTWLLTNYNPAFRHPKGFFTDHTSQQYGAEEPWGPINISVPDPFSGGHGYIAQVATLDRSYVRYNPQPNMPDTSYKKVSVLYNDGTRGSVDTPTGMDISFPYPYGYTKGGTAANPTFTLVNSNYTWEVGSTGYSDDQPFQYYATTAVDGGGNLWHDSGANDSFDTWVMYQPPSAGGGTIYVPLMKLTWKWGGFASRYITSRGVWSSWTSGEGTPFTEGSPAITEAYPSWNYSIPSPFSVGP